MIYPASNRILLSTFLNYKSGFVEAVASEWKSISKQEKAYWESMAKNEKTRFAKEKEALCLANKGPIVKKVRAKKNPLVCVLFYALCFAKTIQQYLLC